MVISFRYNRGVSMKKRIAVCGNGWNNEFLKVVLTGIQKCAKENNVDIFVFLNYSVQEGVEYKNIGETNIFRLLDYANIDGVILLANSFHLSEEYEYLTERIKQMKVPAISLEYKIPDIDYMGSDNYSGMYDMCKHLTDVHEVQKVVYVSGPEGNDESNIRRRALEDVLYEKGLKLEENNIIYGNWSFLEVQKETLLWMQSHTEIPDVFVCANDVMALGICSILREKGIRVPEDVIVTGYDHLVSGIQHNPKIATVDRNWNDMGYKSLQHLLDKIEQRTEKKEIFIKSRGIPTQSCGCEYEDEFVDEKSNAAGGIYDNLVNSIYWGGYLCDIAECMTRISSDVELHDEFNAFLEREHTYEGREFYICLLEDFFTTLQDNKALRKRGYTKTVDVICGVKDGIGTERLTMDISQLIPGYKSESEQSGIYVFSPLYSREGCYGYVVFCEDVPMMYDYSLYNWLRNLKQSLGHVRQNVRMSEMNRQLSVLSLTDGLTGVYNRMGCERVAYPFLERRHALGKRAILMFADINKMKVINDKYGHLQGDLAICTVAKVIREVLNDDWIVVRYGGDEFLMVGECEEGCEPSALLKEIDKNLEKTREQMQLPYPIKAGLGYVIISPEEKLNLSDCLRRADEAMYEMKKKQHDEMKKV